MGLNNLAGGRGFTLGKFTQNFNSVADHGAIKNFREPIRKIIAKNEAAIRGGRFKSAEALRKLQQTEKLSYDVKRDVGRIFKRLETTPAAEKSDRLERRAVLDKAMKGSPGSVKPAAGDRPEKAPIKVRINRADTETPDSHSFAFGAAAQRTTTGTALGASPGTAPGAIPAEAPKAAPERISFD